MVDFASVSQISTNKMLTLTQNLIVFKVEVLKKKGFISKLQKNAIL